MRIRITMGASGFATLEESRNALFFVFKPMLLAYDWAPLPGNNQTLQRMSRCETNNAENEPYFLGLALAACAVLGDNDVLTVLALVQLLARILHTFFFITFPYTGPEPRTFAYDFGVFSLNPDDPSCVHDRTPPPPPYYPPRASSRPLR